MNSKIGLLFFFLTRLLLADGGTVLFHKQSGDLELTVFSKAEAVHAGPNDFSVMVQRPDNSTVMDAAVLLRLDQKQNAGEIMHLTGIATHAKASNKMLYATSLNIPSTGRWHLNADVSSGGKNLMAGADINVLPPQPPMQNYWPFVAMVPLLGIAFFINRKLREKYRVRKA